MSSPVFTRSEVFNSPSGMNYGSSPMNSVMTLDNTVRKTVITFAVLIAAAGIGWFMPILLIPALIVGFILGLVNAFKREPSPPLILAYACAEGLVVGGLSGIMEQQYSGIVSQAVIGTICVVLAVLFLYRIGAVRASAKSTKIFLFAMVGYLLFSLVNVGLSLTGVISDPWGLRTSVTIPGTDIPLGIVLGVFAILLASYSLVMDFSYIEEGVRNRIPERFGWTAAFGIMVTVVWLYLEILRLLAISRD